MPGATSVSCLMAPRRTLTEPRSDEIPDGIGDLILGRARQLDLRAVSGQHDGFIVCRAERPAIAHLVDDEHVAALGSELCPAVREQVASLSAERHDQLA